MDGSHDGPTSLVTEVTPNLLCLRLRDSHARTSRCGVERRRAPGLVPAAERDLDSEGGKERSFFERQPRARLEARAQVSRQRGQLEAWNNEGVLRVRSGGGAPRILANKRDRPDERAFAV